jgi:hypothetical protein
MSVTVRHYQSITFQQDYEPGLPVVAFKFSESFKKQYPRLQQGWIQTLLRTRGWYASILFQSPPR